MAVVFPPLQAVQMFHSSSHRLIALACVNDLHSFINITTIYSKSEKLCHLKSRVNYNSCLASASACTSALKVDLAFSFDSPERSRIGMAFYFAIYAQKMRTGLLAMRHLTKPPQSTSNPQNMSSSVNVLLGFFVVIPIVSKVVQSS